MQTIQAPRVLLLGDPGSGKTDSLTTIIKAGLELFVLVTEPGGVESLIDAAVRRNLPMDKLHWSVVPPSSPGFTALRQMAVTVKAMSFKDIADIKQGVGKTEMRALEKLLDNIQNFHCERTGKDYGDVTEWGDDRAFALDSMSGVNLITLSHTIGYKPSAHQGEWGIAMNLEEQLFHKLSADCKCLFALTGHVDREFDTVIGTTRLAPAALGSKLGPRIPRFFGEVVRAIRDANGFYWSTADSSLALKNRALPVSSKLEPTFEPIIDVYRKRKQYLVAAE